MKNKNILILLVSILICSSNLNGGGVLSTENQACPPAPPPEPVEPQPRPTAQFRFRQEGFSILNLKQEKLNQLLSPVHIDLYECICGNILNSECPCQQIINYILDQIRPLEPQAELTISLVANHFPKQIAELFLWYHNDFSPDNIRKIFLYIIGKTRGNLRLISFAETNLYLSSFSDECWQKTIFNAQTILTQIDAEQAETQAAARRSYINPS